MKVHEYQAKAILSDFGIPVPKGGVATTPEEAGRIAGEMGDKVVVKAQVHAGGRGLAGGVKVVVPRRRPRISPGVCWASVWSLTRPGPTACPSTRCCWRSLPR